MARKSTVKGSRSRGERDRLKALTYDDNKKQKGDDDDQTGTFVFFHPDLGIGGAERLVVDAAVGLQERGHTVVIYTNHCDPEHCFDECRDGTLDVRVLASGPIPMSVFNRLTILCAILRHIHLLLLLSLKGEIPKLQPTAFIVDQLSAGQPLLRYLFPDIPILFYCHFPDLLLAHGRDTSLLKRLYRLPFDRLEQWSMGFAQGVAVNSEFTRGIVGDTWPRLREAVRMRVVYPCVDTGRESGGGGGRGKASERLLEGQKVILSINRFERKKDIGLALRAFAAVPEEERNGARLVIAGGYDHRIEENVSYLTDLQSLATSLSLAHDTIPPNPDSSSSSSPALTATAINATTAPILFLPSITNATKAALLRTARLLVYTPSREHFGIVPLEAMRARVPVLAASTGGPVETIRDGVTGWLRDPLDEGAWTDVVSRVLADASAPELKTMGEAGLTRVKETFGRDKMAARLEAVLVETLSVKPKRGWVFNTFVNILVVGIAFAVGLVFAQSYYMIRILLGEFKAVPPV